MTYFPLTTEQLEWRRPFERCFREARAGMVMGIAHDIAVLHVARSILPKPKEWRKT